MKVNIEVNKVNWTESKKYADKKMSNGNDYLKTNDAVVMHDAYRG